MNRANAGSCSVKLPVIGILALALFQSLELRAEEKSEPAATAAANTNYEVRATAGWKVHVSRKLLATEPKSTVRALELLQKQLEEVVRVVPAEAVAKLKAVTIWFSPEYPNETPKTEYHPEVSWLEDNGRNPDMAQGVEVSNTRDFEKETAVKPTLILHALAHAYHNLVVPDGSENSDVMTAFERAKSGGKYDRVERTHGPGQPNTSEEAQAMMDELEYFAETSEAFFTRNDFFPFTRADLEKQDPEMCALLKRLWGVK